jgi:S-disulfanyl-L-cysteine oxidoreductase SoxD
MSSWVDVLPRAPHAWAHVLAVTALGTAAALFAPASDAQGLPGLGRPATAKELAAWDIDVRPDFKGLPKGSGSVAKGQDLWESKCAMCHGVFGESNEVFTPLVGGTTADDVRTGHVKRLTDGGYPGRTTLMKVATVSTLWDYINRAMPWNAPKSLAPDEVYALTAFLLNLGGVLPDDFVLSDQTMAQAQARMPNRLGMTTEHGLWPGRSIGNGGKPDVKAVACMKNCSTEANVASMLPDFARNAHGNLAEQNRAVGAQHGADTTRPAGSAQARAPAPAPAPAPTPAAQAQTAPASPAATPVSTLLARHTCTACHAIDSKLVGPALRDVAAKHGGRADALAYLSGKIKSGGVGTWGQVPMPPQSLSDEDARAIAQWLIDGAHK